jgi:putative lipoic acid-binding regulatory protein
LLSAQTQLFIDIATLIITHTTHLQNHYPTNNPKKGGRYISVTVGPVLVRNADDVLEVYTRMKTDARLRYFL